MYSFYRSISILFLGIFLFIYCETYLPIPMVIAMTKLDLILSVTSIGLMFSGIILMIISVVKIVIKEIKNEN